MFDAIEKNRPDWVIGENVANLINMELEPCLADLESIGYEVQPIIIPACAVDAKHRRDRIWIIAHANEIRSGASRQDSLKERQSETFSRGNANDADAEITGQQRRESAWHLCTDGFNRQFCETVPDTDKGRRRKINTIRQGQAAGNQARQPAVIDDYAEWPVESGFCRVVDGIPNRAHRLAGLGNAIVPQLAEVILKTIYQISYA